MAAIRTRKTKNGVTRYQVIVRIKGFSPATETFDRMTDAKRWAAQTETAIRDGKYFKTAQAQKHTVNDLIDRYIEEELPKLRSGNDRKRHLKRWREEVGNYTLADCQPPVIIEVRNKLSKEKTPRGNILSPSTVNRYLATLSHAFSVAQREWQWTTDNPFRSVSLLKEPEGRDRYLSDDERERLLAACKDHSDTLYTIIVLALSSGARKSEILNLRWKDIDLKAGLMKFERTKNGYRRLVPLQGHALELVQQIGKVRKLNTEYIFPSRFDPKKPLSIENIWKAALRKAEIEDFKFHDLRHSAASYLAMAGVPLHTIGEILGHRDLKMTQRYSHLSREHVSGAISKLNDSMFSK